MVHIRKKFTNFSGRLIFFHSISYLYFPLLQLHFFHHLFGINCYTVLGKRKKSKMDIKKGLYMAGEKPSQLLVQYDKLQVTYYCSWKKWLYENISAQQQSINKYLVSSYLECYIQLLSLSSEKDIAEPIEVQRMSTKVISSIKQISYEDKLNSQEYFSSGMM